ncbi:MAG: hypothetical protein EP330_21100 [Deltaproteobacteria bacterium]|nr:MAG: hypothetical protein EP330_21100 [Deltaproteobacteria bacterium]
MTADEYDDLIRFAIAGDRPVKTVRTESGGLQVLGWDWKRKIFVPAPEHFMEMMAPQGRDIEFVDEETFEARVDDLLFA